MDNPGGSYAPRSPDLSALPNYNTSPPPFRSHQPLHPSPPQYLHSPSPPRHLQQQYSLPAQHPPQHPHPQRQEYLPPTYSQQLATGSYQPHPEQPYASLGMPVSTRSRRGPAEADPDWLPQPAMSAQPPLDFQQHEQTSYGQAPPHFQQQQQGLPSFPPPADEVKPCPGEAEGIVVKTKFPVARIKRIVQADEDVGKVAQVTPVVVAKALEIFMISLTLRSAEEARARGVKKVTGAHLKQVIQKDEQFDFLSDIVAKIPDAPASKKERDEDDDLDEMGESAGRKKKGAPRKKRKEREGS